MVSVVTVLSTMVRVPDPEALVEGVQLFPVPPVPVAVALKEVCPGGVVLVVETVNVDVRFVVAVAVS